MSWSPETIVGPMITMARKDEPSHAPVERPLPDNLFLFLPYAGKQLQLPFDINVQINEHEEPTPPPGKSQTKHLTLATEQNRSLDVVAKKSSLAHRQLPSSKDTITLLAGVNKSGEVVSLTLPKGQSAPRVLFRTIALSLPHQRCLTKLVILSADYLNGALMYDLAKILPQSFITELILDDSPVLEANQYLILEATTSLRRLSLDRCQLTDIGITNIASTLEPPRPAAFTLRDLSVASNFITDKGSAALTHMLRSNRTLMRLNLSGNQISDEGGENLLRVLGLFELTPEEEKEAKKRLLEYFLEYRKAVSQIYEKELATYVVPAARGKGPRTSRSRESPRITREINAPRARKAFEASASAQALVKAKKYLGEFNNPFCKPNVTSVDGKLYALGNFSLCFLNLAYNNLRHSSILMLIAVLQHQTHTLLKTPSLGCGLVRLVIDGNDPFASREDLDMISNLIDQALERRGSTRKRRGRESIQSRGSIKGKSIKGK